MHIYLRIERRLSVMDEEYGEQNARNGWKNVYSFDFIVYLWIYLKPKVSSFEIYHQIYRESLSGVKSFVRSGFLFYGLHFQDPLLQLPTIKIVSELLAS